MRAGEVSPQEFLQGRFHRRVRLGEDLLGFRRIVLDLVLVMPGSKEVRDCFVIHHLTFCKVGAPPVGVKYRCVVIDFDSSEGSTFLSAVVSDNNKGR